MKKSGFTLFLALVLSLVAVNGTAQLWFDLGLKGSYGTSFMLNSNIFDDDRVDHRFSPAHSYGASIGIHFDKRNGIVLEYLRSRSNQKFDDERTSPVSEFQQSWITNDVGLYFKHSGYGMDVEIGPKIGFVNDAFLIVDGGSEEDMVPLVTENLYSGVLGFGSYLMGSESFTLQLGIRVQYQFNDLAADGEDGVASYPVFQAYEDYSSTNPIHAQLMLEFNYVFGRFAKESCRDRWKLILFR